MPKKKHRKERWRWVPDYEGTYRVSSRGRIFPAKPGKEITTSQKKEIRRLYATGDYTQPELAGQFGTTRAVVNKIVRGSVKKGKRLIEDDVKVIRNLHTAGESYSALAKKFGVSNSTICEIVNYKTWKNVV